MPDETESLRLCVKELAALSALAAQWGRGAPQEIAAGLANLLGQALPVEFAYVRLSGQSRAGAVIAAAGPHGPAAADQVHEIERRLEPLLGGGHPEQKRPPVADPSGKGTLTISPLGCDGDCGVVVTAWPQPARPTDRLLLDARVSPNRRMSPVS